MKVKELKVELIKRGLPVAGLKRALVDRLKDGLSKKFPLIEKMSERESANLAGPAFDPSAHWEELVCDGEFVIDSIPEGFRAPTVPVSFGKLWHPAENHTVKGLNVISFLN